MTRESFPFRSYCKFVGAVMAVTLIFNVCLFWHISSSRESNHQVQRGLWMDKDGALRYSPVGALQPGRSPQINLSEAIRVYHHFNYLINPRHPTRSLDVEMVVCIFTSFRNFGNRRRWRSTAHEIRMGHAVEFDFLFFVGLEQEPTHNQFRVKREAKRYDDIVQANFTDSHSNLTLKAVAILDWVTRYYSHCKYVVKLDDDIGVNPLTLLRALRSRSKVLNHFVIGNSKYLIEGPIRDKRSKYFISMKDYTSSFFPIFAHGPAYAFPLQTAKLLLEAAKRLPLFPLEDVFITGICAQKAHVPVLFDEAFAYVHSSDDSF